MQLLAVWARVLALVLVLLWAVVIPGVVVYAYVQLPPVSR